MQPDPAVPDTTEPDEPQDCGHDLEAFARLAQLLQPGPPPDGPDQTQHLRERLRHYADDALREQLDQARRELETMTAVAQGNKRHVAYITEYAEGLEAERDRAIEERDDARESAASILQDANRLADTVRRYQPVIDAARAWRQMRLETPTKPKPEAHALIQAVDALDAQLPELGEPGSNPGAHDPIETGTEAALGEAEEKLRRVRASLTQLLGEPAAQRILDGLDASPGAETGRRDEETGDVDG